MWIIASRRWLPQVAKYSHVEFPTWPTNGCLLHLSFPFCRLPFPVNIFFLQTSQAKPNTPKCSCRTVQDTNGTKSASQHETFSQITKIGAKVRRQRSSPIQFVFLHVVSFFAMNKSHIHPKLARLWAVQTWSKARSLKLKLPAWIIGYQNKASCCNNRVIYEYWRQQLRESENWHWPPCCFSPTSVCKLRPKIQPLFSCSSFRLEVW